MDEDFADADADATLTIPLRAGELKKGSYVVMSRDKPCQVMSISTSKTGKHGHAKASFVAMDIFTGRRYEDSQPTSHNVAVPVVTTQDFQLLGVSSDGFASLRDLSTGAIDESLRLPPPVNLRRNNKEEDDAYLALVTALDSSDVYVTVLSAMGLQAIMPTRAATPA